MSETGIPPRVRAVSLRIVAETVEEHAPHLTGECQVIRAAAAEIERLAAERDNAWNAVAALNRSIADHAGGGNVE